MRLSELELVIPTEDMLFILNNCSPISFVMLDVDWANFRTKNEKQ